jgi:thiol-disulfide isomerase/thioredoxin
MGSIPFENQNSYAVPCQVVDVGRHRITHSKPIYQKDKMNRMNYLLVQRSLALGMAVWLICAATGWAEDREVRPFRIRSLAGERFDSRKASGPVVLSFFFTRCPPCVREMPALLQLMREREATERLLFVDPYVRELGIQDSPDSERQILRFVRELGIPEAQVYFDEIGTLTKKFWRAGVFRQAKRHGTMLIYPTIVVVDAGHKVRLVLEGSPPDFLERIAEVL